MNLLTYYFRLTYAKLACSQRFACLANAGPITDHSRTYRPLAHSQHTRAVAWEGEAYVHCVPRACSAPDAHLWLFVARLQCPRCAPAAVRCASAVPLTRTCGCLLHVCSAPDAHLRLEVLRLSHAFQEDVPRKVRHPMHLRVCACTHARKRAHALCMMHTRLPS